MLSVAGFNHITFAVSDLGRAIAFYTKALGLTLRYKWEEGAYLEAGNAWICLSFDPNCRAVHHPDYTHFAFDVADEQFDAITQQIKTHGGIQWKDNNSEGKSFYFLDLDHHKLEIHVGTLETRLAEYERRKVLS